MADSETKAVLKAELRGILDHTASWARVLEDGRIELEYYDYSPAAQNTFGNDVAWMYRIDPSVKPRWWELLGVLTGAAITCDQAMLDSLVKSFEDVKGVRDWLVEKQIPYEEEFDSWA